MAYTEQERQEAKEQAIVLALNLDSPAALSRDGLDMFLIRADGSKDYLVTGDSYDSLWADSLKAVKELALEFLKPQTGD
jgi:hypothetical protein